MTISRTKIIGIAAASIALVAGTATTAEAGPPVATRSTLQAQENAIVAAGTPGVSAEVRDSAGVWRGVSGVGDVRNGSKPDAGGEIRVGSISKTFIATMPHPAEHGYEQLAAGKQLTDVTTYNMTWGWTAGAVVSTEADLNRFYAALLAGELLPAAQLREMQRTVPMNDIDNYGLGLIGTEVCGTQIWGHDGSVPGYATYSFSSADGSRQITVSANQNLSASPASAQAINSLLATEFCGAVPSAAPAIARASDSPAAG